MKVEKLGRVISEIWRWPLLGLILALTGCSHHAYEGFSRPDEEVANVACSDSWWAAQIDPTLANVYFFSHVDGVSTYGNEWTINDIPAYPINEIEVLPGTHAVTSNYDRRRALLPVWAWLEWRETITLEFVAKAGHTNKVYFERDNKDSPHSWIVDENTKEIVAESGFKNP